MSEKNQKGQDVRKLGQKLLRIVKHILLHNWAYKLLALVIAVILWAGLIAQDPSLTRDKTFTNVSVNVTGMDTLKKNGYVVVNDINELLENCQFTVAVPQKEYDSADVGTFSIRLDLSRILSAGPQEIRLQYTNSSTYGNVVSISPETITVNVEEYLTRSRIPVSVTMNGNSRDGWYVSSPTADPALIAVSGPKSVVETISRAKVTVDPEQLEWTEGVSRISVPFELYDRSGTVVNNPQIETTSESVLAESVIVEQTLYPMKEVELGDLGLVSGNPASGYEISNVLYTPEKLYIAAPKAVLDGIGKVFTTTTLDASRKKDSFSQQVRITRPNDVYWMNTDTVNVEVEITPVITDKTYQQVQVTLLNVPTGMKATSGIQTVDVEITGEELWLKELKKKDITVFADLDGIEEEGVYTISLDCSLNDANKHDFTWNSTSDDVEITLVRK